MRIRLSRCPAYSPPLLPGVPSQHPGMVQRQDTGDACTPGTTGGESTTHSSMHARYDAQYDAQHEAQYGILRDFRHGILLWLQHPSRTSTAFCLTLCIPSLIPGGISPIFPWTPDKVPCKILEPKAQLYAFGQPPAGRMQHELSKGLQL